ncbi:MAG TPA: sugar transferase [Actinophytocola sp.]|jgi:hypothetical protein|uniref:sugar transferase n=1 Tax=Actinophytocola sp. TaxID=1872138 RepID=UPI002E0BD7D7|nr:sugar transferase [Actinophytocola sp.]
MTNTDIVIVNWNTGNYLRECLRSIALADQSELAVGEVVVVDNASTDESASDLAAEGLPLRVISNATNLGFAGACNQGAAGCRSDQLLFLNPDTRLHRGALRAVGRFLETVAAQRVGICGARIVDEQGRPTVSCSRFPTLRILVGKMTNLDRVLPHIFPPHHLRSEETLTSQPVDQVIGAFYLVRRSLFVELGGFDEGYFLYYEEVDLALRARQRGWLSYLVSEAQVQHVGNVSTNRVRAARLGHSLSSRTRFARQHWPRWQAALLVALTLSVELAARLARAAVHRSPTELRDTVAGYRAYLRWLAPRRRHGPGPLRRAADLAVGLTGLVVLSPLLVALGVLVRNTSRGTALFRQQRVGERGRVFVFYKFRTMPEGTGGPEVTSAADARVTPLGRALRRTGLDELPQLINLVRGDMTLVGPRPETPGLAARYPEDCRWVFDHRPGITGPVQLRSRELAAALDDQTDPEAFYLDALVPRRVALDATYLEAPTLSATVCVLARTVWYALSAFRAAPYAGARADDVGKPVPRPDPAAQDIA